MNRIKTPSQIKHELLHFFEEAGCNTGSSIARATGINQSQIYRNLYCEPKRVSGTLKALCDYANISVFSAQADPSSSKILMQALGSVWDGSDLHARRLAELLFAHRKACL